MGKNPYLIQGPALVSFSGGRTSAFMLHEIIRAHCGRLPSDIVAVFANTGKEMPATLDFVAACAAHWNVPIVWLEYKDSDTPSERWRQVTYETASRDGAPFSALIARKKFLPNPTMRFCTIELKIRVMKLFAQQHLGWKHWDNVIGLRADEPRRVARSRAPHREVWENVMPLATAGVKLVDITRFWETQAFKLELPTLNGKTLLGNCDLCFLKGRSTIQSIMRVQPELGVWWIEQERQARGAKGNAGLFRKDRPNYATLLKTAAMDKPLDFLMGGNLDDFTDCHCGDLS